MNEITSKEFITSKNTWVPTKLETIEGSSNIMISQFSSIPIDAIDSFYNDRGDIHVTKSGSKVDPTVIDS